MYVFLCHITSTMQLSEQQFNEIKKQYEKDLLSLKNNSCIRQVVELFEEECVYFEKEKELYVKESSLQKGSNAMIRLRDARKGMFNF